VHNTVTFAENNGKTTLTVYAKVVKVLPEATQALAAWRKAGRRVWNASLRCCNKFIIHRKRATP
jgi:hypothetical protein